MNQHPLAGKLAPPSDLEDIPALLAAFESRRPDPTVATERVSFGTSGHRGSSLDGSFNADHIRAICQAIAEHRRADGITGPLFLGMDTHALSRPARCTALEVFAANAMEVRLAPDEGFTPTPVISHAILTHNRRCGRALADGVILTPSHNPPRDGGIKYNPPSGGPADTTTTAAIETRANALLEANLVGVESVPYERALRAVGTREYDYVTPYVNDLPSVIDFDVIRTSGLRIGVDPMGGAGVSYWQPVADRYGLQIDVVNQRIDPTFAFMHLDKDGAIRMDCSSPWAMSGLVEMRSRFDIAFGNDPDADRHGIVTPSGLMNPNHFLSVCVQYLLASRPDWSGLGTIGKTLVSSSMIDRVVREAGRPLYEVPVGFKWFVEKLASGEMVFAGEESAGATFLRRDGSVWSTDKDGILLNLLGCEITASTGKNPAQHYSDLEERFGRPVYRRSDIPATAEQKAALRSLSSEAISADKLAGDPVKAIHVTAPGNRAPIGGVKVESDRGWFAARPSGTESVYKVYAESFRGQPHLEEIESEARSIIEAAFRRAGID